MKTRNRRSGFTLPEILVTVTVIAVLAAVVVPAVTQYSKSGDGPGQLSDFNAIRTAVTAYVSDHRTAPTSLTDLAPYATQLNLGSTATTATYTSAGYGFKVANLIRPDTVNGTIYLALALHSAAHNKCSEIDTAIDNGTGATSGSFLYPAAGDTAAACLNTTAADTAFYLLMQKP